MQIKYRPQSGGEWLTPTEGANGRLLIGTDGGTIEVALREEFEEGDTFTIGKSGVTIIGPSVDCVNMDGDTYPVYPTKWHDPDTGYTFFEFASEANLRNYRDGKSW